MMRICNTQVPANEGDYTAGDTIPFCSSPPVPKVGLYRTGGGGLYRTRGGYISHAYARCSSVHDKPWHDCR